MDRKALIAIIGIVVVAVVIAAFLLAQGQPQGGNGQPVTGNSITISDLSYRPGILNAPLGTTVTWTNNDSVDHTIIFDSGPYPSSERLGPGQSFNVTFDTAGTFTYHCSLHPSMKGSVVIA